MRRILELVIMTSIMTIVYKLVGFEFVVITVLALILQEVGGSNE